MTSNFCALQPPSAQLRHFNPGSAFKREVVTGSPTTMEYLENLCCILNMELEALQTTLNTTVTRKVEIGGEVRVLQLVSDSFDAKLQLLMRNDYDSVDEVSRNNNEAKKALMEEVMEEKRQELNSKKMEAVTAEHEVEECERVLRLKKIMLDGVKAECELLRIGRPTTGFHPTPILYPSSKVDEDDLGLGMFLKITTCSLCGFAFPKSDIIVSSCKHMYHPFCAKIVYQSGNRCVDLKCTEAFVDPDWFRSLGVGTVNGELQERAASLGCVEEDAKVLAKRYEDARLNYPDIGTLSF